MVAILAASAEDAGSSSQGFQVNAFEGVVVGLDGRASVVQVGVEFLAAVENSKQFPFDVCVSCLDICLLGLYLQKRQDYGVGAVPRPFMEAST